MAELISNRSILGNDLSSLLMGDQIVPGSPAGYQLCKSIFLYHPLGQKMVCAPIALMQSQKREISIPNSPERRVREAYLHEWEKMGADRHIFNGVQTARTYGEGTIVYGCEDIPPEKMIPLEDIYKYDIFFNVLDPLLTTGSSFTNQDPNSQLFLNARDTQVQGVVYHKSRSCVIINEHPVYLSYTDSSFGFTGRSVYQRALFPLKSFINSMITDDMVARKAGVIIAKTKQQGSAVDKLMKAVAGIKRVIIKNAETENVITIDTEESIETLGLQDIAASIDAARKNILINAAVAADMPAVLLNEETFAEGFGEGTEDAKKLARYIERFRNECKHVYDFFDTICMYRAWNPEFYKTIQNEFSEYKRVPFKKAFYDWRNSFVAPWPSLLIEPDSEKIKVEDTKLKAVISAMEVLLGSAALDPDNKAQVLSWMADCFNENKMLFPTPLLLDIEAYKNYTPDVSEKEMLDTPESPSEPHPLTEEPDEKEGKDEL